MLKTCICGLGPLGKTGDLEDVLSNMHAALHDLFITRKVTYPTGCVLFRTPSGEDGKESATKRTAVFPLLFFNTAVHCSIVHPSPQDLGTDLPYPL